MRIAIIGGGLSGLATAYFSWKKAEKENIPVEIYIFEKETRCGGTISTVVKDGFILEYGPNGFLNSKQETLNLIRDLNLQDKMLFSNSSRKRYVYDGKRLWKIPQNAIEFLFTGYLSITGKIRMLSEFFIPPENISQESVADFVRRRLGKEALEKLIEPMVRGVYAGDIEKLEIVSAFPRIKQLELEYGSLFKAMYKLKRGGAPPGVMTSFQQGLSELIEALERNIKGKIVNEEVCEVTQKNGKLNIKTQKTEMTADKVIFAVPAYALKEIFKPVSHLCEKIIYVPLCVVHLAYDLKDLNRKIDGFGFISLKKADTSILGAIYASNIFPNRAPKGKFLVSVMIGGADNPQVLELSDDSIRELAIQNMGRILNIHNSPQFLGYFRHKKAIPQYNIGHSTIIEEIEKEIKKTKGIFLCGNAFYGVGINDIVKRAKELSEYIFQK